MEVAPRYKLHKLLTLLTLLIWLREGSRCQIRLFFGKVPKGGEVIFNLKIYVADFGIFKQGFLSIKLIQ